MMTRIKTSWLILIFGIFSCLTLAAQDISITITAESGVGTNDGIIDLQVNDIYDPDDNPGGINNPPFHFVWTYEETIIPESEYSSDPIAGSCELTGLEPGEYCVIVTQSAGTSFECAVSGCFTVEAFDPGEFNVQIQSDDMIEINQILDVNAVGGNNGGGNITYDWTLPGGNPPSSNEQEFEVTYSSPGVKNITLFAQNEAGQTTETSKEVLVTDILEADFDYFLITETSGFLYLFQATVEGVSGFATYDWNFGDGTSVNGTVASSISHNYVTTGSYEVTLTVTDEFSTIEVVKTILVISNDFSVAITSPAAQVTITSGTTVSFTAEVQNAVGTNLSYTWYFGDGSTMTTFDPIITHTYNSSGCHMVRVEVADASEIVSDAKSCLVFVNLPLEIDGISIADHCRANTMRLVARATGGNPTFVSPIACEGIDFLDDCQLFSGTTYSSYGWTATHLDGTVLAGIFDCPNSPCTGIDTDHPEIANMIANGGGDIIVAIQITDEDGVSDTRESVIPIYEAPEINYEDVVACPKTEIILGDPANVYDGSLDVSYTWGGTSTALNALSCTDCPNPLVLVPDGTYNYTLSVEVERFPLQNCVYESSVTVTGQNIELTPTMDGSLAIEVCSDPFTQVTLGGDPTATGGSGNYSYNWQPFNHLNNPFVANPRINGLAEGETQSYTLTVLDDTGCMATTSIKATGSYSEVFANAGQDIFACHGSDVMLGGVPAGYGVDASGAPILDRLIYQWSHTDEEVANPLIENITTEDAGIYSLSVVDSQNGCRDRDVVNVSVNPEIDIPGFQLAILDIECVSNNPSDQAFTAAPNQLPAGYTFSWNPTENLSDPTVLNPIVTPTVAHPFSTLTIEETATGCTVDMFSKRWALYDEEPSLDLSYGEEYLCPNQEVCFTTTIDFHYLTSILQDYGLITPQMPVAWEITDLDDEIIDKGNFSVIADEIVVTEICTSFPETGSYTLSFTGLANACGADDQSFTINVGSSNGSLICNNDDAIPSSYVVNGLYTSSNIEIAGSCLADVVINDPVQAIASEEITINDGFHAENGSSFLAAIGTVSGCNDPIPLTEENQDYKSLDAQPQANHKLAIEKPDINVYPNPFTDQFLLSIKQERPLNSIRLSIYSSTGQQVKQVNFDNLQVNAFEVPISLPNQAGGMYWCKIQLDNEIYHHRIVKE